MFGFSKKKQPTPYELEKQTQDANRLVRSKERLAVLCQQLGEHNTEKALELHDLVQFITSKSPCGDINLGIVLSQDKTLRTNHNTGKFGFTKYIIESN